MSQEIDLSKILDGYSQEVRQKLIDSEKETAQDTVDLLKQTSPKRTGKYSRGWYQTESPTDEGLIVANKQYQLTHLLEFGHATRNGGRTQNYPHIAPAEREAVSELEDKVRKALEQ